MQLSVTHTMFYIAVLCPPEIDREVENYKIWMKEQYGCVVALKSPAHITLVPPFWLETNREAELRQTMESFASTIGPLEIRLNGFSHFGKRVLFIRVEDNPVLQELQVQCEDFFRRSFADLVKKSSLPFHPHVTIANRDLRPLDFFKAWGHFSKKTFYQTFAVSSITLLKLGENRWNIAGNRSWSESRR